MQRNPENQIIFNEAEVQEFAVPPVVAAEDAILTAATFAVVAESLSSRAAAQLNSTNHDSVRRKQELDLRAGRLAGFSERIFGLCPNEHLQFIMDTTPVTRRPKPL
jgi:hypothetical protein